MSAGRRTALWAAGAAVAVFGLVLAPPAQADTKFHSFQFTDEYYLENGVDVGETVDHYVFPDAKEGFDRTRLDTPPDERYNDVRVIENTGGYMHNGSPLYYITPSKLMRTSFTDDAAGDNAHAICNEFRAFIFPKADGDPLVPAPPNRRQDNVFETNGGYFSNSPLGCWRLVFVSWDGPNVGSEDCIDEAAKLMEDNGADLDGTPVITDLSDIEGLTADGCIRQRVRSEGGDDGFPWVI